MGVPLTLYTKFYIYTHAFNFAYKALYTHFFNFAYNILTLRIKSDNSRYKVGQFTV